MASTYKTPGIYIQEISKFPPSVAEVETAIPAFIGYTEKALENGIDRYTKKDTEQTTESKPEQPIVRRITSLLEYENFFGLAVPETGIKITVNENGDVSQEIEDPSGHNMYYCLQGYFANGGGPCYIVSVGKTSETDTINLEDLKKGLEEVEKEDEVTLIVFPESLSLETANFKSLYDEALSQCNKLQDRFVVMDVKIDDKSKTVKEQADTFRSQGIGMNYLKYGAAYCPSLETVFNYRYKEEDINVTLPKQNDEGELIKTDGGKLEQENTTMKVINPNSESTGSNDSSNSNYGQYYPLVKKAISNIPVVLPAAPLVVGVYAAVDSSRGVWKAPANVSLSAVIRPTVKITKEQQENLNIDTTGKSINAIRSFQGKGTLIWGARTLAGNDNEWRYVPVRRFFNFAEESIKKATEGFVFEPNDANTWTKVKAMIENFLTLQWRAGALAGAKPDQAFYAKIGLNETMTSLDILEGRMIIEIGMAVVRPAEFIILKFSHKMQES